MGRPSHSKCVPQVVKGWDVHDPVYDVALLVLPLSVSYLCVPQHVVGEETSVELSGTNKTDGAGDGQGEPGEIKGAEVALDPEDVGRYASSAV